MASLENIQVKGQLYDIAAKFDNKGNVIADIYATKTALADSNTNISSNEAALTQLQKQVDTIDGNSEVEGSYRKAIKDLIGGAPEAYDTLKEIADKLATDDTLHDTITAAIAEKAAITDLNTTNTKVSSLETQVKALDTSKTVTVDTTQGDYSTTYSIKQNNKELQAIEVSNAPKVQNNILYL